MTGATISRSGNYWFISVSVETSQLPKPCENQALVGIDLGVKTLATLSNGQIIPIFNTVSSNEIDACRQDGSVIMLKTLRQRAWLKQELSPV
ncbi:MAG: hypothetical protein ACH350_02695 [Parachlamydiaceae bacterium]